MDHNQGYAMAGMRRASVLSLLASVVFLSSGGACVVTVEPDPGGGGGGGGGGGEPPPETIRIRVINTTNVTLDPEIYVSPFAAAPQDLFAPINKTTKYGVGTLGILADHDEAEFEILCPDAITLGTSGGRFGNDLSSPDGTGTQIVLRQNESIFCGSRVTFTYTGSGSNFSTTYVVEP